MRTVGIKELKDQASSIVSAGEAVVVERYGQPVGVYVPIGQEVGKDKLRAYQLADDLNRLLERIAQRSCMTQEQLADEIERLARANAPQTAD